MIVQRNPGLEDMLLTQLAASFDGSLPEYVCPPEPERTGVHLSDLLKVRQSAFKRMMPEPTTPKEAQLWMYGRGFEVEVIRRSGLMPAESRYYPFRDSTLDPWAISYRPDFDVWPGVFSGPIELKWRRANLARNGEEATEYEVYLAQIRGYCALGGSRSAKLIVNTPRQGQSAADHFASTQPATWVYDVSFDAEELDAWRVELVRRAELFVAVLEHRGSVKALPLCADWLCGAPKKTTEASCIECAKPLVGQWAEKHTGTKVGAGHTIVPPTWGYDVRCAWYDYCRPFEVDHQRGPR